MFLKASRVRLRVDPKTEWRKFWTASASSNIEPNVNPKTNTDLYLVSTSDKKVEPFWQTNFIEASTSKHFRLPEVSCWSRSAVDPNRKWRADGRELYYYAPSRKLMAVEVNGDGSTFTVGTARPLLDIRVFGTVDQSFPGNGYYTPTRNGSRFLVPSLPETPERQQINVILNWTADLKK